MTREEIVAFFDRWQTAMNRQDVASFTALYAADCVVESPTAGTVRGPAAVGEVSRTWFQAFPDLKVTLDDVIIDGDRIVEVFTFAGTDTGGFMGVPPTGKPFRVPMVLINILKDDKIQQERRIYDFTGLLVQIGVLKAKPV
jgi:steroid delta-isomerase-like uncharacterized protein